MEIDICKKNALAELDLWTSWFMAGALQATKELPPLNSPRRMFSFHLN